MFASRSAHLNVQVSLALPTAPPSVAVEASTSASAPPAPSAPSPAAHIVPAQPGHQPPPAYLQHAPSNQQQLPQQHPEQHLQPQPQLPPAAQPQQQQQMVPAAATPPAAVHQQQQALQYGQGQPLAQSQPQQLQQPGPYQAQQQQQQQPQPVYAPSPRSEAGSVGPPLLPFSVAPQPNSPASFKQVTLEARPLMDPHHNWHSIHPIKRPSVSIICGLMALLIPFVGCFLLVRQR